MSPSVRTTRSTTVTASFPGPVRVRTTEIPDPGDLTALPPSASSVLAWLRGGDGVIGWGRLAMVQLLGPDRFAAAQSAWGRLLAGAEVVDEVGLPGTGAIAFTSFTRDTSAVPSVLVVPRFVVGRRQGRSWITELGTAATTPAPPPIPRGAEGGHPARLGPARLAPHRPARANRLRGVSGVVSASAYRSAVAAATDRIQTGRAPSVVLARDLLAEFEAPIDARRVLARLTSRYDDNWSYAVDGLVGLTPGTVLRKCGTLVESRVRTRVSSPDGDGLGSPKIREEHRLAVDSLRATLSPVCTTMRALTEEGESRHAAHSVLTTDVRAVLDGRAAPSILRLLGSILTTRAMGGAPSRSVAAATESALGVHGGRYAGPIGWIDACGDGEFGIALPCAQLCGGSARLYAGSRIGPGADPDAEVAESTATLHALADILGT